jgi:hypothetical protein
MASYASFRDHMREKVPGISDEEIIKQWSDLVNTGQVEPDFTDALKRGAAGIGEALYGAMRYLGLGEDIELVNTRADYPNPYAQRHILEDPGVLTEGGYWSQSLGELIPQAPLWFTPGGAISKGLIAGGQEVLPEFTEQLEAGMDPTEARLRTGAGIGGIGLLEAIPFAQMMRPTKGVGDFLSNIGKTALKEGTTEVLEEPVQALAWGRDPVEALYQGINVFPIAAATGGLMGGVGPAVSTAMQPQPQAGGDIRTSLMQAARQNPQIIEQIQAMAARPGAAPPRVAQPLATPQQAPAPLDGAMRPSMAQQVFATRQAPETPAYTAPQLQAVQEQVAPLLDERGDIVIKADMKKPSPAAMRGLVAYADQAGTRIRIDPGESKRDAAFYKRVGFRENVGETRDETIAEPMVREPRGQQVFPMTAYHGSPHKLDQFSTDKIGTGEGAQAYGYGLYFAENPAVAKSYSTSLSPPPAFVDNAQEIFQEAYPEGARIDGTIYKSIEDISSNLDWFLPRAKLPDNIKSLISNYNDGFIYEVDIKDETIDKMLDWDKPLSKEKLRLIEEQGQKEGYTRAGYMHIHDSGEQVYRDIADDLGEKEASDFLNRAGIPGIKYLDQGSRAEGEGTRNFVVFDAKDAKILSRNGQPITQEEMNALAMRSGLGQPSDIEIETDTQLNADDEVGPKAQAFMPEHQAHLSSLGIAISSALDPASQQALSAGIAALRNANVPARLFDQVGTVFGFKGNDTALMVRSHNGMPTMIGINPEMLANLPQAEFLVSLAHEFGHVADIEMSPHGLSVAQVSPEFGIDPVELTFDPETGVLSTDVLGPIVKEAAEYYAEADLAEDAMAMRLGYPLADLIHVAMGNKTVNTAEGAQTIQAMAAKDETIRGAVNHAIGHEVRRIQAETFAQLFALYHTTPQQMKQALPQGYRFVKRYMEALNAGQTISDARQSIQRSFWPQDTERGTDAGGYRGWNAPPAGFGAGHLKRGADPGVYATKPPESSIWKRSVPQPGQGRDRLGNLSERGVVGASLNDEEYALAQDVSKMFGKERARARRGTLNLPELDRMAAALGMQPDELARRVKGSAWNAEKIRAGAKIVTDRARSLRETAERAQTGDTLARAQFLNQYNALAEVLIPFQGVAAEAGRALMAFRGATAGMNLKELTKIVNDPNLDLDRKMDKITGMETPGQIANHVGKEMTPTWADKLLELWINNLLSGPQTQIVNLLSNALVAGFSMVEHAVASGISGIRGDKNIPLSSVLARSGAMATAGFDAAKIATRVFRHEQEFGEEKIEARQQKAISGAKGRLIRIPGRLLSAGDAFYKVIAMKGALAEWYNMEARNKGLKGKERHDYIQTGIRNPSDRAYKNAMEQANYYTFTRRLGKFGQLIQSMAREYPILRVIIPFIRTPLNIVKFAGERTPFGLAMKEVRDNLRGENGRHQQNLQISRLAVGSSIMMAAGMMAAQGLLTGGGPSDQKERNLKYQQGWMPYSIKVGDKYYAYGRLEPLGMLLGIAADLHEIGIAATNPEEAEKIGGMLVGAISKNLTSKTFLRGISEVINAVTDPDRYGDRWVNNLVGTLIPTLSAQIARTNDPTLRITRDWTDTLMGRIPGQRERLTPRVDLYGRPIVREQPPAALFNPIYKSTAVNDPVAREFERLRFLGGRAGKKVFGQELTDPQRNEYQRLMGESMRRILQPLIQSPRWDRIPDDTKRDIIEKILSRVRKEVKPIILKRVVRDKLASRQ